MLLKFLVMLFMCLLSFPALPSPTMADQPFGSSSTKLIKLYNIKEPAPQKEATLLIS